MKEMFFQRLPYFKDVLEASWYDWKWQLQNAIQTQEQLQQIYANLSEKHCSCLSNWEKRDLQIRLTPYLISLAQSVPSANNPIWRQFFPVFDELLPGQVFRSDEYSNKNENWENNNEMLTPICHWKYDNRVIVYSLDTCFSYCTYCLRSIISSCLNEKHGGLLHWQETIDRIKQHPEIEEVIISGGDPLVYDNNKLEQMFSDVRQITSIKVLSLNTRTFTHNPYRIDEQLCKLFNKYRLIKLGIHITHPVEITQDFIDAADRLSRIAGKVLPLAQIVLVKGVNDNVETLRELFISLYSLGIKPYYLLHNMPNIPSAASQRTSVKRGVELLRQIKRKISNPAVPEYIIVHRTGKKTVPFETNGTSEFYYTSNKKGESVVRFKDWRGNWEEYLDGID